MKKPTWFIFSLLLIISCLDQPDCFRINNDIVGISFKVMGTGDPDTVALLGVQLSGTDSVFSDSTLVTTLGLPLNYTTDETNITFNTPDITWNMRLKYLVSTQFVSEDCGERYVLSQLEVLEHNFDSVKLVNASPGKTASSNIEVYRCPVTDVMDIVFRELTYNITSEVTSSSIVAVYLTSVTDDYSTNTYYPDSRTASVYLPVDLAKNATTFTFNFADGTTKKLALDYTLTTVERYKPCGEQTFVSKMNIAAGSDFDSASFVTESDVPRRTILDPVEPMINLYKCPVTNMAGVSFKQRRGSSVIQDTVILKNVSVDFPASIFYPNETLQSVNVPLNPNADQTVITFELDTGTEIVTRTITVSYTTSTETLFDRCGPNVLFTGLEVVSEDFDTVTVADDELHSLPIINLEVIQ